MIVNMKHISWTSRFN